MAIGIYAINSTGTVRNGTFNGCEKDIVAVNSKVKSINSTSLNSNGHINAVDSEFEVSGLNFKTRIPHELCESIKADISHGTNATQLEKKYGERLLDYGIKISDFVTKGYTAAQIIKRIID